MNFQEECQPAAKIPTIPQFIPHTQPIAYDGKCFQNCQVRQLTTCREKNDSLQQGVRWKWVRENPGSLVSLPKLSRHEVTPPDVGQVKQLLAAARSAFGKPGSDGSHCWVWIHISGTSTPSMWRGGFGSSY